MKLAPAKLDRAQAMSFLLTNLLVLPGMGTVMAGWWTGYVQGGLAVAGAILTSVFAFRMGGEWWVSGELTLSALEGFWRVGATGFGLFVVAWCWSLVSGLRLLRRASVTDEAAERGE